MRVLRRRSINAMRVALSERAKPTLFVSADYSRRALAEPATELHAEGRRRGKRV